MPDRASSPGQPIMGCPVFLSPKNPLNERQRKILGLAAQGLTDEVIGRAVKLTARTVRWHLKNIFRTLEARNRTHAVALAVSRGYINIDT